MSDDHRGLRFPFEASAELFLANSSQAIVGRVTELSLRGCFLETSVRLDKQLVRVKIFNASGYFESAAEIIYTRSDGAGLVFGEMNPHFRSTLQKWVLATLDHHVEQPR